MISPLVANLQEELAKEKSFLASIERNENERITALERNIEISKQADCFAFAVRTTCTMLIEHGFTEEQAMEIIKIDLNNIRARMEFMA